MNYGFVLNKYYGDKKWACGLTYDEFYWDEEEAPKPPDDHLQSLWKSLELQTDTMRQKRNSLLAQTDYKVVSDFPQRDKWLIYRQELRDFPSIWTPETSFPTQPE